MHRSLKGASQSQKSVAIIEENKEEHSMLKIIKDLEAFNDNRNQ
jgi:hypothetical protein